MATTIQVDEAVRDRLKAIGGKDETYNEIVERLLDHYEETDG